MHTMGTRLLPEQSKMEATLTRALKSEGWKLHRGHPLDKVKKHGFIDSQKMGMEVFRNIPPDAPLIIAEATGYYHVRGLVWRMAVPLLDAATHRSLIHLP